MSARNGARSSKHLFPPGGSLLDADLAIDDVSHNFLDVGEVVENGKGDLLPLAVVDQVYIASSQHLFLLHIAKLLIRL